MFGVADLGEVAAWVLSWGRNARVLAPPQLAGIVCDEARGLLQFHQPPKEPLMV